MKPHEPFLWSSDPTERLYTRRTIVRGGAAGLAVPWVAGLAFGQDKPGAEQAPPKPARKIDKPIRIGLIGCGGRGTGAAVQALRADPDTQLVAMADVFADRLKSSLDGITQELGSEAPEKVRVAPARQHVGFDAFQKVIDSDVEVVLLTSYPAFRPAHLRAAITAGKHVFAEKPLAVDAPGLRSVLESAAAARQKNLACMVGFCWRYHDGMRATFEQLQRGALGDIVSVYTNYHTGTLSRHPRQSAWTDVEFQLRNWWHFTWISGDHIVEQAIHSIDRLAWAMGDLLPKSVTCLGGRAARNGPEHGNSYDHFAAVYEYADGRRCHHACRQIDGCPSDNTDYVLGTQGRADINGWNPETFVMLDRQGHETWRHTGENKDMYQNEHDALFASIRAKKPINDCVRGANSTLMAIMARMAAYTGQTITWEQALASQEVLGPAKLELGALPLPEVAVPGRTKFA